MASHPQTTNQHSRTRSLRTRIRRYRRIMLVAAVWGMLLLALHLVARHNGMNFTEVAGELADHSMGAAGPLIFILVAALSPILLVPAALLGAIAGLSFGPFWGVVCTLIGCNLSATLTYILGHISVRHDPAKQPQGLLRRYSRALHRRAFLTIVALRLSFLPYDPVNYMIGVARVPYFRFLAANTVGSLPGVVAIVLAGASVQGLGDGIPGINPALIIAAVVVAVIGLGLAHILAHRDAGPV